MSMKKGIFGDAFDEGMWREQVVRERDSWADPHSGHSITFLMMSQKRSFSPP
jgi:hypothetical protein